MKNNKLGKNKVLNAIVAFSLFFLQSDFIYAQGAYINALPHGYTIVNGNVVVDYVGHHSHTLDITASNNSIINWKSFNIGKRGIVDFIQPNSSSVVLNRVVGIDPSSIYGILKANGRVFIVNANGVFFGANSQVNVNGLLASTLNISNGDFLNGNYNFTQNGKSAWIINQGNIHVANGGYVLLLSNAVNNSGLIEAKLGHVILAAGEKMTVALDDDNDINVTINEAVKNNVFGPDGTKILQAIQNSGSIAADGGTILLNAKILNGIFDNAVNNTGVIQANSLVHHNGDIEITAVGGDITSAAGSVISAKAEGKRGQGGNITLNSTNDINLKKGSTLDVSGGTKAGNGGKLDLIATNNLDSQGTINGFAANGYNPGAVLMDPTTATVSGAYNASITVYATGDITITGNTTIGSGDTLSIFADNTSGTAGAWSAGIGGIIDTGGYTISGTSGSGTLNLAAGSDGIGSLAAPLLVSGLSSVSAAIDPSVTGNIAISNTGANNLYVGTINAGNGNVNLSAANGSILNSTSTSLVTGNTVSLTAANGIGLIGTIAGKAINTTANTLNANVTSSGLINLNNMNTSVAGVNVANVTTQNGAITVYADGNINAGTINAAAGASNVTLSATKVSGGSILDANSSITGNLVTLKASNAVGSSTTAINTKASTLTATASNGSININQTGTVALNASTGSGSANTITVNGSGDINVGTVNAGSGASNVVLNANGSILDNSSLITGNVVSLTAANGIGSSTTAVNTTANTINANVTSSGLINLNSKNTPANGVVLNNITTHNGPITVTADGQMTAANVVTGGTANENISLQNTFGNMIIGNVNAGLANVTLNSTGNILASGSSSQITGNNLNLSTAINANPVGNQLTLTNGITTSVVGGYQQLNITNQPGAASYNIYFQSGLGAPWQQVATNYTASTGGVTVWTASTPAIIGGFASYYATVATALPAINIGSAAAPINTNVNTITAGSLPATNITGNIYLNQTGTVNLSNVQTPNGSINVTSGGTISAGNITTGSNGTITITSTAGNVNVGTINSGTGNIILTSNTGSINGLTGTSNIIGGTLNLSGQTGFGVTNTFSISGGSIITATLSGSPIVLNSTLIGPVFPITTGSISLISTTLVTVGSGTIHLPTPVNNTFAFTQASSSLPGRFVYPTPEKLSTTQINTFDTSSSSDQSGGLFLYHPLTNVDSGAFDQAFQLDQGAYDFIDGQVEKKP